MGIIGSAFVSKLHAKAFQEVPQAEVVVACWPKKDDVEDFARKRQSHDMAV